MFVIMLSYIKSITEVELFVTEHREFLQRYYASGHFLLSGPQQPRTGGVIIARGATRAEIEEIIRHDPFHREGIARYEIVEFLPKMATPDLAAFKV